MGEQEAIALALVDSSVHTSYHCTLSFWGMRGKIQEVELTLQFPTPGELIISGQGLQHAKCMAIECYEGNSTRVVVDPSMRCVEPTKTPASSPSQIWDVGVFWLAAKVRARGVKNGYSEGLCATAEKISDFPTLSSSRTVALQPNPASIPSTCHHNAGINYLWAITMSIILTQLVILCTIAFTSTSLGSSRSFCAKWSSATPRGNPQPNSRRVEAQQYSEQRFQDIRTCTASNNLGHDLVALLPTKDALTNPSHPAWDEFFQKLYSS